MSAVIVVDTTLRERVIAIVRDHQRTHPTRSLAGEILEDRFEATIDRICELIDLDATDDVEIAVVIALARKKDASNFSRPQGRKYPPKSVIQWTKL